MRKSTRISAGFCVSASFTPVRPSAATEGRKPSFSSMRLMVSRNAASSSITSTVCIFPVHADCTRAVLPQYVDSGAPRKFLQRFYKSLTRRGESAAFGRDRKMQPASAAYLARQDDVDPCEVKCRASVHFNRAPTGGRATREPWNIAPGTPARCSERTVKYRCANGTWNIEACRGPSSSMCVEYELSRRR